MAQPTAEEWWRGLDEADRSAFMKAATTTRTIPVELWQKLKANGVAAVAWTNEHNDTDYYLPRSYLRYVLERAAAH